MELEKRITVLRGWRSLGSETVQVHIQLSSHTTVFAENIASTNAENIASTNPLKYLRILLVPIPWKKNPLIHLLSDNGFHSKYLTIFFPIFTYYLHALYFFDCNILYIMLQKKKPHYYFTNVCYYHCYQWPFRLFENITFLYPERKGTRASNTDPCVS